MRNVTPYPSVTYSGGKIDRPGIYAKVPIRLYHGDLCVGPSVSSGTLRRVESESLEHVYDQSYLNPDAEPQGVKAAWTVGRAAHTLLLGESGFREDFLIRPDTYPNDQTKVWNGNSKDCKEWLAKAALAGKEVLKSADVDNIRGMATKLGAHPTIRAGILNGLVERSIIWKRRIRIEASAEVLAMAIASGRVQPDGAVTIWCKARPDAMPIDANMIADYKTCDDASGLACRRSITDYGYHMQLAWCADGMLAVTGRQMTDFNLVFQEKARPWSINIKPISSAAIAYGRMQNERALRKFARAYALHEWEGYEDDEVPADLMPYAADRLAKELELGLLSEPQPDTDPSPPDDEEAIG